MRRDAGSFSAGVAGSNRLQVNRHASIGGEGHIDLGVHRFISLDVHEKLVGSTKQPAELESPRVRGGFRAKVGTPRIAKLNGDVCGRMRIISVIDIS